MHTCQVCRERYFSFTARCSHTQVFTRDATMRAGRRRHQCKECGGASLCEHGRQRNRCKECVSATAKGMAAEDMAVPVGQEMISAAAVAAARAEASPAAAAQRGQPSHCPVRPHWILRRRLQLQKNELQRHRRTHDHQAAPSATFASILSVTQERGSRVGTPVRASRASRTSRAQSHGVDGCAQNAGLSSNVTIPC